ncbi:fish-egg lectin-like [Poecilia latipinna]|uniref:Fish-egg lectin-like n=1 Tax=Poecilia latipinna TaxID=48699 RepID=A0A3B3TKA0_9TELE|nr:PREDICTED: fish-egg lectin-like [Poecilia latipinna]
MKALATFLVLLNYFTRCHGWICTTAPEHAAAAQVDAGNGMVVMTDKNSNAFFLSDSSWSKLGSVPLKHVTVGYAGVWGVDLNNNVYKFAAGDFFPTHGLELMQVDAGEGQVVGVTSQNSIHCLKASSASSIEEEGVLNWNTIPGALMYMSCGPLGCWGVNSGQNIFFTKVSPDNCSISGWRQTDGAAVKVEVGTDGRVFVVIQSGHVYERTGISEAVPQGTGWSQITFCVSIKHVTYDLGRLWLLTNTGVILNCI